MRKKPVVENELETLMALRRRPWWRMRFPPALEQRYRGALRKQLRWVRSLLLLSFGLGFAVAPFQEDVVFQPSTDLAGIMQVFAWIVTPVAWVAAALTWFKGPVSVTRGMQTVAIVAALGSALALRWLALQQQFQYPPGMLGVVAIAIAFFGGFAWYRLLLAFSLFFALAITQEFAYAEPASGGSPYRSSYVLFFSYIISVFGALANEYLRRQNWTQHALAMALSRIDVLTGLSNRADFERRFQVTLEQARRDKKNIAVLMLDIDHFKHTNDRHGHAAGDQALRAVADAIVESSAHRPLDVRARTGGEEFIIVWYDAPPAVLPALVGKVMDAIRGIRLETEWLGEPLKITASVGVCWTVPGEATSARELVHYADGLMYRAKREGRDRVVSEEFQEALG